MERQIKAAAEQVAGRSQTRRNKMKRSSKDLEAKEQLIQATKR